MSLPVVTGTCVLHLDASETSSLTTSGGAASAISDLSGAGNNGSAPSGREPTLTTRNSIGALDFGPYSGSFYSSTANKVMNLAGTANGKHFFLAFGNANGGGFPFSHSSAYYFHRGDTTFGASYADKWTGIYTIFGLTYASGSPYYLNGSLVNQDSTGFSGDFDLIAHATDGGAVGIDTIWHDRVYHTGGGILCEMVIFSTILNTSDRQLIEGYLAWKWDLVSKLPSGHPYKSSPPVAPTTSLVGVGSGVEFAGTSVGILSINTTTEVAIVGVGSGVEFAGTSVGILSINTTTEVALIGVGSSITFADTSVGILGIALDIIGVGDGVTFSNNSYGTLTIPPTLLTSAVCILL